MVEFYELNVILNILKHFKVKNIIINGLSNEKIIEKILSYDAEIIAIDNANDNFDLEILRGNPLNVLPDFTNYDAIFIDDDPNWYTLFNQLNIIQNTNEEFPLVFICNNKFPHKRRDSYSNPNNIPKDFRHEFTKELPFNLNGKKIIIQDNFYHATSENTAKNGVLTAIEDFLKLHSEISIMDIKIIDEITILYPQSTISQIRIGKIMKDIENKTINNIDLSSSNMKNQILLEYISENNLSINGLKEFNKLKIEISEKNETINNFENEIKNHHNEIEYKNSKIMGVESQLNLKDSEINNLESKLINKNVEIDNLEKNLNNEVLKHEKSEKALQNTFNDKMQIIEGVFNNFENQIDELIENNEETITTLKSTEKRLSENQKSIDSLKHENNRLNSKIDTDKYCISCFREEISNNKLEIQYRKNNSLIKNMLSPFSYLILLFKSKPKELSLNIKLYKALKDSNCFDVGYYLKNNNDLIKSKWCKYFSPELHYICKGFNENRKFNKKYFNRNSKKSLLEYLAKCEEL